MTHPAPPARLSTPVLLCRIWLIFAAGVIVIYRGLTQSLTVDEAYTYHLFLNQKATVLFERYDAAYHVLHTWASWLAVHKFGKSEAILRLPGMIAALFYLAGIGVLCRRLLGDNWKFPIGVILLSANPLIADYLSAARGYGSALAFFVWAFDALYTNRPVRASIFLALSVACNLTFVVPGVALGGTYLLFRASAGDSLTTLIKQMLFPFLAVTVPILAVPLWNARASDYYFGVQELRNSLNSLLMASFNHGSMAESRWLLALGEKIIPLLALAMVPLILIAVRQRHLPVLLAAGSLGVSLSILVAAHSFLGVLYPWTRTGLYLIWLFLFLCLALWEWTSSKSCWLKWVSLPLGAATVLFSCAFLLQFNTLFYHDFRADRPMSTIMRGFRDQRPHNRFCIGGSSYFETTVNYYRLRYKLDWVEEMKREDPPKAGCRFFILFSSDESFVTKLNLKRLWTDPISGTILAESKESRPAEVR